MHSSPKIKGIDHTQTIIEIDMQAHIKHTMIKQIIIQGISHTGIKYLNQASQANK